MERKSFYNTFFSLLRAGLWNREPETAFFPVDPGEWDGLYLLAREQTVEGLVYDGILRLPEDCMPPRPLLLKWAVSADRIERRYTEMDRTVGEQGNLFSGNGIEAWLLKGQSLSRCYRRPGRRVCGDIDWYFPEPEDFKKASILMERRGMIAEPTAGFGKNYLWGKIPTEYHRRLFDIHNPFHFGYIRDLCRSQEAAPSGLEIGGAKLKTTSLLLTHILVYTHLLKHSLSFGIGLRQVCDAARLSYVYGRKMDKVLLKAVYKKLGMLDWIQMIDDLLAGDLGLDVRYLTFPEETKKHSGKLTEDILQGGNFGFYSGTGGGAKSGANGKRRHTVRNFVGRFRKYSPYAFSEACWFPVMQFYSRIVKNSGK